MNLTTHTLESLTSELMQNAMSAHKTGDFVLAVNLYQQVIEISPNNLDALHYLGLIFVETDQPDTAIPLLSKAASIKNNDPDMFYNLALAHQKAQDITTAIYFYQQAIELKPDFALAYNNIGVAFQHTGDLTQADIHLKTAFTISPRCIEAHYNYAQSHKFTTNDNDYISSVKKLLAEDKLSTQEKIKLNFALGKIHDDIADYQTAFRYYQTGNSLKYQGYNIEQFSQYVDQLVSTYTPEVMTKLTSRQEKKSLKKFIFIVGMPRSGTTLIEQVISRHQAVFSAGEIGFIGNIVDELPEIMQSKQNYPNCVNHITHNHIAIISSAVYREIKKMNIPEFNITDKSPTNFLHIGLIKILFPESIIIHCNRNPLDTALSCFFQNFEKQHQYSYKLKTLALFYNEYVRLMQHWKSLLKNQIYEVNYEKLVSDQLTESKKLIAACDIPWDDKCLTFYQSHSQVSSASKWQVRQPIYQTSVEKWRNYEDYIGELIEHLRPDFQAK